jgi:hypothetical protein
MSSLDGAIPLVKVDIISMFVSKNLNFDMPWLLDVFFNKHMVITKTLHAFPLCRFKLIKEFRLLHNDSHSLTTSSERGFEHNWEPNFLSLG